MKSDRGVVLFFVCVVLIGIFAALVEQRERRVRRPNALVVTSAVLVSDASTDGAIGAISAAQLAVAASSLGELARIAHPSRRQTTCPTDPLLYFFNTNGPEIDANGQLHVPTCARPAVTTYQSGVCFPDGTRPIGNGAIYGNLTVAVCQARLPYWRPGDDYEGIEDGAPAFYVRDDNDAYFLDTDVYVRCFGYVWRRPSDHCTHPVDVMVAGFPRLQRVATLAERTLVYSIELRPRVPWRDAAELDHYVNVSAWGIPFTLQPDGTYFADLLPDGQWSDTLGATVVSATCPDFCRPYPLDIHLCTAGCPCMPVITTPPTTTPSPATCTVAVQGGLARVQSKRAPSVAGKTILYNESTADLMGVIAVGDIVMRQVPEEFPLVIMRFDECVHSCMQSGEIACNALTDHYSGLMTIVADDFTSNKIVTPDYYADTFDRLVFAAEHPDKSVSFDISARFSVNDCCFSTSRNGVTLNTYYAQFAVFVSYYSMSSLQFKILPGYIYTATASQATRVIDQRTGSVPASGLCVVAFDVFGDAPVTFTSWAARDSNEAIVMSGDLAYNHSARSILILLGCSASLGDLSWTLVSTDEFPGTGSAAGIFSAQVPAQPSCGNAEQVVDGRVTQHDILAGSVFDRGVGVRILSVDNTTTCAVPDPLPADDATAFLLTVSSASSVEDECPSDAVCIDLR